MLAAKRGSYICLSCRSSFFANSLRNIYHGATATSVRTINHLRGGTPNTHRQTLPFRPLSTSRRVREHQRVDPAENAVRNARQLYGDTLPRGQLSEDEYVIYERLYGTPVFVEDIEDRENRKTGEEIVAEELLDGSTVLLRKGPNGEFEEVDMLGDVEELIDDGENEVAEEGENTDEMPRSETEWEAVRDENSAKYHQKIYDSSFPEADDFEQEAEDDGFMRAHPLTKAGQFALSPSTVYLPKETFVDPVSTLLTRANHKHLAESANRIFGGRGLPFSATTASASLKKEQKPIPIDPSCSSLDSIEGDAYMAAVMPGTFAAVMSTLVEVRRRLGTPWIEHLLQKKGGPLVLDAGSAGAGILAWHEVLKAEWQRMDEQSGAVSQEAAPLGKATVLTGSEVLRHRASRLLDNTTFIPHLPDVGTPGKEDNLQQPRKLYDLIIAPHTLWPLNQEYLRKEQVEKYWSLLNPKGGVLILLEKGLPRGFEVIAAARQHLLDKRIASPQSTEVEVPVEEQAVKPEDDTRFTQKEIGMIIAPCTNHNTCPMYQSPGVSQGRKDFCYFSQRYIRPPYLQRILEAKDRNHENVQFSYVALQRGRDQRLPLYDLNGKGVVQNAETTDEAFEGHEWNSESELRTTADVNPLSFPRLMLPPLKRRGHIILDVCTPSGKLERWTVPRSFSKQAFRDARKARWGDLWALGAKTRIPRAVRLGNPRDEFDKKGRRIKKPKQQIINVDIGDQGFEGMKAKQDGRYAQDRKIRGSGGRKGRKQKPIDILDD